MPDNEMNESLNSVFDIEQKKEVIIPEKQEVISSHEKKEDDEEQLDEAAEADFEKAKQSYDELVKQGKLSVERMIDLADSTRHPRAYEVLANLLKTTSEMVDKQLDLHQRKKRLKETTKASKVTNNSIFVGTSADLQELLKGFSTGKRIEEKPKEEKKKE